MAFLVGKRQQPLVLRDKLNGARKIQRTFLAAICSILNQWLKQVMHAAVKLKFIIN
jgi:hypothetical protein